MANGTYYHDGEGWKRTHDRPPLRRPNGAANGGGNGSDSGENVDLTGYATEEWVREGYQPKGSYLTAIPIASTKTLGGVKPTAKTEGMGQPVGVDAEGGLWTTPGTQGQVLIAPYDAPESVKKGAHYVCAGEHDQIIINQAIQSVEFGKIHLCGGNYNLTGGVSLKSNVSLIGENAELNVCDMISELITQAYTGGDTVIHVANASRFVIGQKVSTNAWGSSGNYTSYVVAVDADNNTITLDTPWKTESGFDADTYYAVADFTAVQCWDANNCIIEGIIINGNHDTYTIVCDTSYGNNGIQFVNATNCRAINCETRKIKQHGFITMAATDCYFVNCIGKDGAKHGFDFSNSTGGDGGIVAIGCVASGNTGNGIQVHYGKKVVVSNGVFHNNSNGLGTQGSGAEVVFSGNVIYGNSRGIICSVSPGKNIRISDNIITGNNEGIQIDTVEDVSICGNMIYSNATFGIKLLNTNHFVVANNKLHDNCDNNTAADITENAHIVIKKACSYGLVTGNNLRSTSTDTKGCACGVAEYQLTGDCNIVTGNIIRGARIAATQKLGANSKFENNYEFA